MCFPPVSLNLPDELVADLDREAARTCTSRSAVARWRLAAVDQPGGLTKAHAPRPVDIPELADQIRYCRRIVDRSTDPELREAARKQLTAIVKVIDDARAARGAR